MLYYDPEVCRMTGITPVAAILAERLLIEKSRGNKPTQEELASLIGAKKSGVATAIKELKDTGLMDSETGDLEGYRRVLRADNELPNIPIMEVFKSCLEAFNRLHQLDNSMPTYTERNRTILNYIKLLIKNPQSNQLVKGKDKFESLSIRIKVIVEHRWWMTENTGYEKSWVTPYTLLRNANKFYDNYLVAARNHYLNNR